MINDVTEKICSLLNAPDGEFRKALDLLEDLLDSHERGDSIFSEETLSAAIGEISEALIAHFAGAKRTRRGTKGHDLVGPEERRTEVKARLISTWGDSLKFDFGKHTRSVDSADLAFCLVWTDAPRLNVIYAYRLPIPELCERWGCNCGRYCARTTLSKLKKACTDSTL